METIKENTTWQTVYEQLQEILNKCIEMWWIPRWHPYFDYITLYNDEDDDVKNIISVFWTEFERKNTSIHNLFSKDSGLMEFVEWKPLTKASSIQLKILYEYWLKDYNYLMMSLLTVEEKIQHFLSHATIPTKSEK